MYLLDVNLWLALALEAHDHHAPAQRWFDRQSRGVCYFCRFTQIGFLRISTSVRMVGTSAVPIDVAWRHYDELRADSRVGFAAEPAELEFVWRRLSSGPTFTAKHWNDAYLAAFADRAGLAVVSFDRDFQTFEKIKSIILSA